MVHPCLSPCKVKHIRCHVFTSTLFLPLPTHQGAQKRAKKEENPFAGLEDDEDEDDDEEEEEDGVMQYMVSSPCPGPQA